MSLGIRFWVWASEILKYTIFFSKVSLNGRKNRLFMTMLVCKNLKDILDKLEKDGRTAVVPS